MQKRKWLLPAHFDTRVILWLLIAIYTFFLPDARLAYDAIVNSFGQSIAGRVPIVLVSLVGLAYALAVYFRHRSLKNLIYLIPCAVIAYLIMHLVANPNKHIHIPEYVLMAWLLFAVLSKDYKSRDIFILIFICTSALGVVDELEQGIHPARFYGLSDMMVNSASGLIGVFTIMGLMKTHPADWDWTSYLKEIKGLWGLSLAGMAGVVAMCSYLFRVQASGVFRGIYPDWLLAWNIFYLVAAPLVIFIHRRKVSADFSVQIPGKAALPAKLRIAQLWTIPMLVIIFYMYALLIYISISGTQFI